MYVRDKFKAAALYICGGLAVGICLALIVYFIFILNLRTEYREFCLTVNDAILASAEEERFIQRGEKIVPLTSKAADYYDAFLLDRDTVVINRRKRSATDRSIQLHFSADTLSLTGYGDGSEIHIRWDTPEETKNYTVRNSSLTFLQLDAYMENYLRRNNTE